MISCSRLLIFPFNWISLNWKWFYDDESAKSSDYLIKMVPINRINFYLLYYVLTLWVFPCNNLKKLRVFFED